MKSTRLMVLALLAAGCAAHQARLPEAARAVPPRAAAPVVPAAASVEPVVGLAHAYRAAGLENLREGDLAAACDNFDLGIAAILESGLDLASRPDLEALVAELRADVARASDDATLAAVAEGEEEAEPASGDAIATVEIPEVPSEPQTLTPSKPATRSLLVGDMPLELNNQVQAMLNVYSGDLKDFITAAYVRSGRYLPMVHQVFKEEGVPLDLAWLALVESAFKPRAYSRAQAKGIWQFIGSTGKMYGLDIDFWVDERGDPVKATHAAARHLKDLHAQFGDWYLALAAYNAGGGKISSAISRAHSRSYWDLARTRYLKRETRNYVPGYLAALLIADDPRRYGFDFTPEPPLAFDEVEVPSPFQLSVLAKAAGIDEDALRDLNPELRRGCTPGDHARYTLKVPAGAAATVIAAIDAVPESERVRVVRHQVAKGETVARIAARYGTSVSAILAANSLRDARGLKVGAELVIPATGTVYADDARKPVASKTSSASTLGRKITYRVRPGDTLTSVAKLHKASVTELASWNRIRPQHRLIAGTHLVVYVNTRDAAQGRAKRTALSSPGLTYTVKRGDDLTGIARTHGVSLEDVRRWNSLASREIIQPGDRIRLYGHDDGPRTR